jgi:thiamine pyrophosphate-dependent acetolactate synthase large subunit-like protein
MAKTTGNDLVVKSLKDEGVDTVFYLTGGPMVDVASRCIEIGFRSVDVRHEQAAAMAAHAYSRVLGKPGVCFAASGPGATNLITGVGNAFLDAVPVVALGGASALSQAGMGAFQEMDQIGMFKPITKWSERVMDVRRVPEIINKAFRVATSGQPGPSISIFRVTFCTAKSTRTKSHFPRCLTQCRACRVIRTSSRKRLPCSKMPNGLSSLRVLESSGLGQWKN